MTMTKEKKFQELFDAFTHDVVYLTEFFPEDWKIEFRDLLVKWLLEEFPND